MIDREPMHSDAASFKLLTSLRYDPKLLDVDWNTRVNDGVPTPIMLLPYHVDRLVEAAGKHGWSDAGRNLTSGSLASACEDAVRKVKDGRRGEAYKVR